MTYETKCPYCGKGYDPGKSVSRDVCDDCWLLLLGTCPGIFG